MAGALKLLNLWPEVGTYHVAVTAKGAKPFIHDTHMGAKVLAERSQWPLQLSGANNAHFFVRPEHPSAVLVDLDRYEGAHLQAIKGLQPRCIIRTSADKRHAFVLGAQP